MSNAVRRRRAAGGGLLAGALVAGLLVTAAPATADARTTDTPQNDAVSRVTFTTDNRVPVGSEAEVAGPLTSAVVGGVRSATFTADVDMNDASQTRPSINPDLRNPDPVTDQNPATPDSPGPGPVDPGRYDVVFRSLVGTQLDRCDGCLTITTPTPPTVTGRSAGVEAGSPSAEAELVGTGFARSTRIEVLRPGTDVADVAVVPGRGGNGKTTTTTLRRSFDARGAAPGPRDLRLTNTDGQQTRCSACFTVLAPGIQDVTPRAAANTAPVVLTLTTDVAQTFTNSSAAVLSYEATNAGSATREALSIRGTNPSASDDGRSLRVTFDLTGAAPGAEAYRPVVTTGGRTSVSAVLFSVSQDTNPTVTGTAPATGPAGSPQTVSVSGTGFARGAEVFFERQVGTPPQPDSVRASAVEFLSSSLLRVTVAFPGTAAAQGDRTVRVVNTNGRSGQCATACYRVTEAPASPSASATASPTGTPTATPSRSATPTASASPSRSATPTATASPTRSATPTATASPTPSRAAPRLSLPRTTITSQEAATVNGTGEPGSIVELWAYSRPRTTYVRVRRTVLSESGTVAFSIMPSGNTRMFLRTRDVSGAGQQDSPSVVLTVRTSINVKVTRTGAQTYRFTGSTLPKRAGQTVNVRYRRGSGSVVAAKVRVAANGTYSVTRRFTGRGTFTFFTATGVDINNAAGTSNAVRVSVR